MVSQQGGTQPPVQKRGHTQSVTHVGRSVSVHHVTGNVSRRETLQPSTQTSAVSVWTAPPPPPPPLVLVDDVVSTHEQVTYEQLSLLLLF